MRWSSWSTPVAWLAALLAAALMTSLRSGLAARYHDVRAQSDAFLLPDADQTYVASLGYRAALADLIFGHVLVSYGLHFQEERNFEHVGQYLDVINRLDPKFRDPYRFADTLLTLQPREVPEAYVRKARQIQERGMKELPYDQELWATAGQFQAYLAPSRLKDAKEQEDFRMAGARALMRACDLVGSNEAIPYHCITAAKLLDQRGNRAAARDFLERVLTVNDNPKIQELAGAYLRRIAGEGAQEQANTRQERFLRAWQADLPFVPRVEISAVGPDFDLGACAGVARARRGCATSWAAWAREQDAAGAP